MNSSPYAQTFIHALTVCYRVQTIWLLNNKTSAPTTGLFSLAIINDHDVVCNQLLFTSGYMTS